MADAHAKHHDYHLVDPSPWPFVGSVAAFVHGGRRDHVDEGHAARRPACGPLRLRRGLIGVLYTMFAWWRDVIKEAEHGGDHTRVVQIHHRYGMILFIASEVMFFVAWFWAYFDASLFADEAMQFARTSSRAGIWPPKGIETFDPWHLPLLNTLILLTSGTTVTWAHHALLQNDRQGLKQGLCSPSSSALLFTVVQAYEYCARRLRLQGPHLRRDLLHGDGLPRLPRPHRHDLPGRLPVSAR